MEPLIDSSSENSDDNICSICFEKLDEEKGEIKTMECCKQIFHKDCIDKWLSNYSTSYNCPHCRKSLLSEEDKIDKEFDKEANKCFNTCCAIYATGVVLISSLFIFKQLIN